MGASEEQSLKEIVSQWDSIDLDSVAFSYKPLLPMQAEIFAQNGYDLYICIYLYTIEERMM